MASSENPQNQIKFKAYIDNSLTLRKFLKNFKRKLNWDVVAVSNKINFDPPSIKFYRVNEIEIKGEYLETIDFNEQMIFQNIENTRIQIKAGHAGANKVRLDIVTSLQKNNISLKDFNGKYTLSYFEKGNHTEASKAGILEIDIKEIDFDIYLEDNKWVFEDKNSASNEHMIDFVNELILVSNHKIHNRDDLGDKKTITLDKAKFQIEDHKITFERNLINNVEFNVTCNNTKNLSLGGGEYNPSGTDDKPTITNVHFSKDEVNKDDEVTCTIKGTNFNNLKNVWLKSTTDDVFISNSTNKEGSNTEISVKFKIDERRFTTSKDNKTLRGKIIPGEYYFFAEVIWGRTHEGFIEKKNKRLKVNPESNEPKITYTGEYSLEDLKHIFDELLRNNIKLLHQKIKEIRLGGHTYVDVEEKIKQQINEYIKELNDAIQFLENEHGPLIKESKESLTKLFVELAKFTNKSNLACKSDTSKSKGLLDQINEITITKIQEVTSEGDNIKENLITIKSKEINGLIKLLKDVNENYTSPATSSGTTETGLIKVNGHEKIQKGETLILILPDRTIEGLNRTPILVRRSEGQSFAITTKDFSNNTIKFKIEEEMNIQTNEINEINEENGYSLYFYNKNLRPKWLKGNYKANIKLTGKAVAKFKIKEALKELQKRIPHDLKETDYLITSKSLNLKKSKKLSETTTLYWIQFSRKFEFQTLMSTLKELGVDKGIKLKDIKSELDLLKIISQAYSNKDFKILESYTVKDYNTAVSKVINKVNEILKEE